MNIRINQDTEVSIINVCTDAYMNNAQSKLVSRLYLSIQSSNHHSTLYVKTKQEKEANMNLTEEEWLNICKIQSTTSSSDLWKNIIIIIIRFLSLREETFHRMVEWNLDTVGDNVVIYQLTTAIHPIG